MIDSSYPQFTKKKLKDILFPVFDLNFQLDKSTCLFPKIFKCFPISSNTSVYLYK